MEPFKTKIRGFLTRFIRKADLRDDEDIFSSGFVHSLFALQLVQFLESEFAIKIEREDLVLDNFRTVNSLSALVDKKTSSPPVDSV